MSVSTKYDDGALMMIKNPSAYDLLLLGLLRKQAMHGYQLIEIIDRVMASCVDLKKPTAYFLLNRMAKAGWVTSSNHKHENRPIKKVYEITQEGEKAFRELLRENLNTTIVPDRINDFGIIFSEELDDSELEISLLTRQSQLMQEIDRVKSAPLHSGRIQWMVEHHLSTLQHELDWNTTLLERISR